MALTISESLRSVRPIVPFDCKGTSIIGVLEVVEISSARVASSGSSAIGDGGLTWDLLSVLQGEEGVVGPRRQAMSVLLLEFVRALCLSRHERVQGRWEWTGEKPVSSRRDLWIHFWRSFEVYLALKQISVIPGRYWHRTWSMWPWRLKRAPLPSFD